MLGRGGIPVSEPHRSSDFTNFFTFASPLNNSQTYLSRGCTHSTDAHQVVNKTGQAHQLFNALDTPQPSFAQTADGLVPTKKLFDPFAHDLTDAIPRGVDGALPRASAVVSGVDGHVRRNAMRQRVIDKTAVVM